jgi:hypothetical protein
MTIGLVQGQKFRQRILSDTHTGEYEQQVQLKFSGTAGNEWGYVDADIYFQNPFLYAPAQRMVPFDRPHFSKGFELLNAGPTLVHLDAQVTDWHINESSFIVGAKVRIYATAPSMTTAPQPFSAIAHLTFQGFSTYAEGDEYING